MRFKQFYLKESLETFQNELKNKYGLSHLRLEMKGSDLLLDMIVVPKDKRKMGIGSKVLDEITHYADTNKLRLLLTTAVKDDYHGTTSSERLKKFYKKFGFVENKGRNKDFTTTHNMIREPKKVYNFDKINESEERSHGKLLSEIKPMLKTVLIFRARDNKSDEFLPKDYVTLSSKFALVHAESNHVYTDEQQIVIRANVPTKDLAEASNPGEWFYIGPKIHGEVVYKSLGPDEYDGELKELKYVKPLKLN